MDTKLTIDKISEHTDKIQEGSAKMHALAQAITAMGYCQLQNEIQNKLDHKESEDFENYMGFETSPFDISTIIEIVEDYRDIVSESASRLAMIARKLIGEE